MDSSIQKYLAFISTVECGSFTKAAFKLGYAQSSVSKMIADLEEEWGIVLLERSRAGVQLTADGRRMLPYARDLADNYRKVQEQASLLTGVHKGTIRIGTFSSVATHWMPNIISAFKKDYPDVDYEMLLGDYSEIEQWIQEGRVECGFLRLPTKPGFDFEYLETDEYALILPNEHPLCWKSRIKPEDLNGEVFMLLEHGGKTDISEYLEKYDIKPDIRFTTWDDYAIMSMVEKGLGIALLPKLILRRTPYSFQIRNLEEPLVREIGFAVKNRETASASVKKFMQYLKYR